MYLYDDFSADLDAVMLAKRESLPGEIILQGIFTKYENTPFQKLIRQIENDDTPILINLGLYLLQFNTESVNKFNAWMSKAVTAFKRDRKNHDFTMYDGEIGITVHCNQDPLNKFEPKLLAHVNGRKYILKANYWYGLCIDPFDYTIRYIIELNDPWEKSEEMESIVNTLPFKSKIID
jgi:hypothetical protein